ncbi:MAG: M20 family metallopeptidase [Acidimicrobiales bacterium]|jgi:hippurate hydrolase|nr:M20 family metallopeptidase [Acidimicrobiales bacterium]|tara:strand:- start:5846 stop:7018 length:1173 start_codon:yes stop_codon:yes gene_type:complete
MHEILEAATGLVDDAVALRRDIHRHPELGLHNPDTQQRIITALDGLPLEISEGSGITSVVANLDGASDGPTVLLRADTDALPMTEDSDEDFCSTESGRAHACGHDAHVAMLVGAARLLCDRQGDIAGRVRFMFQPGEEGAGGAAVMIDEGVLDGVDRAFAIHVTPNLPVGHAACRPGPLLASADTFHVTVTGRGGHASTPHFCADPVPPMAEMITAAQAIVTRQVDAFKPSVVTITHVDAGTTTNVIPETAFFEGTIRAVSEETRSLVAGSLETACRHIALAHGCSVDFRLEAGYPVTVNDADQAARVADTCEATLGTGSFLALPAPFMGAEDFSYVLNNVPGAMAFLGVCPDDISDSQTAPPCHSNRMRLNEAGLVHGIALHAAMALGA